MARHFDKWSPTFPAFLVAWTVPFWILTSASVNALLPLLGCESCILSHLNCHKDMSLLSMATHLPCISYQRDSSLQCPKYNHTCLDIFLFLQFCFLVSSNKKKLFDTCARAGFQRYFRFTYLSYTSCSENSSLQGTHIYTCQYTFHHPLFWNLDPIVLNLQYDKRSFKMDVYLPCISFHQNSNPRYPLHSRICHGISPCMLFYYLRKCYANSETQNYNSSFFWGSSNMPYQFCISLHVNSSPQDIHNRICPRTFHYPL